MIQLSQGRKLRRMFPMKAVGNSNVEVDSSHVQKILVLNGQFINIDTRRACTSKCKTIVYLYNSGYQKCKNIFEYKI